MIKEQANHFLAQAKRKGFIEISNGVFLLSKEALIKDQKEWEKEEVNKRADFSGHPFWLVVGEVISPIGIDSAYDLCSKSMGLCK